MKKLLLAAVFAVSPALASALTLDGVDNAMTEACNIAAGNPFKAHELASIIDGVGINEGGANAVYAENNYNGKLIPEGVLKKASRNVPVVPEPVKAESGLKKMLKSDKAEGSVGDLMLGLLGLAALFVLAVIIVGIAATAVYVSPSYVSIIIGIIISSLALSTHK